MPTATSVGTVSAQWVASPVWNPDSPLPAFKDLPIKHDLRCAWDVWGKGDQLGTINLLTPQVVAEAAKEIKSGVSVSLNAPLQIPSKPAFGRQPPKTTLLENHPGLPVRDNEIHVNDQHGTQWDGLRHFGILKGDCFYQGIGPEEIKAGEIQVADPNLVDPNNLKLGVHNWADHGIHGRGVFIDMVEYYSKKNGGKLPYDPLETHSVPLADIQEALKKQGVELKRGDIVVLRLGFWPRYWSLFEGSGRGKEPTIAEKFAGIENTEEVKAWIWDNHLAAIASDMPALEAWPPLKDGEVHLHSTIIGMFGSPIGEFFDTEKLAAVAKKLGRYTFFFNSNPINNLGGAASFANASAIF